MPGKADTKSFSWSKIPKFFRKNSTAPEDFVVYLNLGFNYQRHFLVICGISCGKTVVDTEHYLSIRKMDTTGIA